MKIIELTSENVKRLTAVNITPQGNVVVIGGKNGQGKSSVLDSILFALGGDPSVKMPVRRGEDKARIEVDLGEIVVKRTFTAAGGTSLVVTNSDGAKQSSPQSILDKLTGKLTFDPLEFARQRPDVQAVTLRGLVGLDFATQDAKHGELYVKRTAINREAKALESRIASIPKVDGLPAGEISAESILNEQSLAIQKNQDNKQLRSDHFVLEQNLAIVEDQSIPQCKAMIKRIESKIVELEQEITNCREHLEQHCSELNDLEKSIPTLQSKIDSAKSLADAAKDEDISQFRVKISKVEQTNQQIRAAKNRAELVKQFKAKSEESDKLTAEMEKMESAKRKATTEAKYPVDGLLFDTAGGITLNGIPFEQCSSAEQLKVSVAIGFALNPKLKVILIRDGSLLDDESMKTLCEMATKADAQVWIERVGTDATTSVVIEDGHIKTEGGLI
jgi:DNA repair exonuclease SbcCD ATPase subunit